jgi:tetratricopeptide (TPR) repeat protein
MDDLSSSNWMPLSSDAKKAANSNYASAFIALRPTSPISGRSTPLNGTTSNPASKPATPANDSFSSLVSFTSASTNKNLSLQEQQKRLLGQKAQQSLAKEKDSTHALWGGDEQFWNNLGSGSSTHTPLQTSQKNASSIHIGKPQNILLGDNEEDLLADLTSSTQGTKTKESVHKPNFPYIAQQQSNGPRSFQVEDDDDPFGLNELQNKTLSAKMSLPAPADDDDDVLGLLGQPASKRPYSPPEIVAPASNDSNVHPQDRAVAELVDMGFLPEKARQALESTDSGTNVQEAVSWLLNQAHAEARDKSKLRGASRDGSSSDPNNTSRRREGSGMHANTSQRTDSPWTNDDDLAPPRRRGAGASSQGGKDPAQVAAELGNTFLKTAGSLWKQGSKKVQQAYQEFNSDSDSSQPRWMREPDRAAKLESRAQPPVDEAGVGRRRRRSSTVQNSLVTDEALMLEVDRPPPRKPTRPKEEARFDSSADNSRDHSPVVPSRLRQALPASPMFLQQQQHPSTSSRQTLNRQAIEEQASQAYVSSARRRKPASNPTVSTSETNLLEGASQMTLPQTPATTLTSRPARTMSPVNIRPPALVRNIPPISSINLKASHSHREAGNAHFKRGDFSSAHQSYTTSLSYLPSLHPISIILLTNHALTALKIGEPKIAIASADKAIILIGPSKGESEVVDLQSGDPAKQMRDYYGKALMRKAEALEQLERWKDAAAIWREAVEGGHGGATSIQGRMRAEKAVNLQTARLKPEVARKPPAVVAKNSALRGLSGKPSTTSHAGSAAAVNRLRAANAAADKVDDEKFALADSVDARLVAWKGGKADNLRALLGSLDTILWPEAGWKKISMADLVLPNKVKIQYMKGIAKVHPDKVSERVAF